jgi:hypothetical protein
MITYMHIHSCNCQTEFYNTFYFSQHVFKDVYIQMKHRLNKPIKLYLMVLYIYANDILIRVWSSARSEIKTHLRTKAVTVIMSPTPQGHWSND